MNSLLRVQTRVYFLNRISGNGKLISDLSQLYVLRNTVVLTSNHKSKSCVGMSSEQVCVKVLRITATA